jgi:hypothetical protein
MTSGTNAKCPGSNKHVCGRIQTSTWHSHWPREDYCDMRWWINENVVAISVQYPCASLFKERPTALNPCGIDTERLTANCGTDVNVRGMYTLAIAAAQNGTHM